jgi:hypothetical protein
MATKNNRKLSTMTMTIYSDFKESSLLVVAKLIHIILIN